MAIIKSKHASKYTVVPNVIFDSGLSMEAIGLLSYFLSLPHDWVIYKTTLHEKLNIGREKIGRIFKELSEKGYIMSIRKHGENGKLEYEHIVYDIPFNGEKQVDKPLTADPLTEVPSTALPLTALPSTVNQPLLNTNIQSTNLLNTNNTKETITKKAETEKVSVYSECMEIYSSFIMQLTGVKAKITPLTGKSLKLIIAYLNQNVKDASRSNEIIVNGFAYIFANYEKWGPFYKNQLNLNQIESNLINIINSIKNGTAKNKGGVSAHL